MNITEIHQICKREFNNGYDDCAAQIRNPLFALDQDYVDTCIKNVLVEVGCSIMKSVYKHHTPTQAQQEVLNAILEDYKTRFRTKINAIANL